MCNSNFTRKMLEAELTRVLRASSGAAAEINDDQISVWREETSCQLNRKKPEEICLIHWNTNRYCLQVAVDILTVIVLFLALNASTLRTDLCLCMQCSLIILSHRVPIFQGNLATEWTDLLSNSLEVTLWWLSTQCVCEGHLLKQLSAPLRPFTSS